MCPSEHSNCGKPVYSRSIWKTTSQKQWLEVTSIRFKWSLKWQVLWKPRGLTKASGVCPCAGPQAWEPAAGGRQERAGLSQLLEKVERGIRCCKPRAAGSAGRTRREDCHCGRAELTHPRHRPLGNIQPFSPDSTFPDPG